MDNQLRMVRKTLTDLNLDELHYIRPSAQAVIFCSIETPFKLQVAYCFQCTDTFRFHLSRDFREVPGEQ